jgi:mercuric ion binding protein
MKTIKALLTIVIIIVATSIAKAQDAKYHYHDFGLKTAASISSPAICSSFKSSFESQDPKAHYHDIGYKSAPKAINPHAVCSPYSSNVVSPDAKAHYHDLGSNLATTTTVTFKVYGKCGLCKYHIESAAKVNGVSSAKWDESTQLLTVQYNNKVISPDKIQFLEAAVGHDTEKYIANNNAYNNLPACCHYRKEA